jgi:hypothetical protein
MKQKKIIVAVEPDDQLRRRILQRIIVDCGFAIILSDADKLIKPTVYDMEPLSDSYFIFAHTHNFRQGGSHTNQQLYEMAVSGIAVIIGVKKLPPEFEFICQPFDRNIV